jgi:CubicO group peptidase (beta-lactamase class C family)
LQLAVVGALTPRLCLHAEEDVSGAWTGTLNVGSQFLRLRFEVAKDNATLASIDQENAPMAMEVVSSRPDAIELKVPVINAVYRGRQVRPDRIEGEWQQGMNFPLTLFRGEAGLQDAQRSVPPLDQSSLHQLRMEAGAPALAAMSSRRQQTTRIWVDGERALGSGVSVTANDSWHLGSITKSMTATLVARLVEAGTVSWDDTVADLLGESVAKIQPSYAEATFRHLLSHRAGLRRDIPREQFDTFKRESDGDIRGERLRYVAIALNQEPVGPVEKTFMYANNGYVVAAAMLEQKLNTEWENLLHQFVCAPLMLGTVGFGAPGIRGRLEQPVGHAPGDELEPRRVGESVNDNPVVIGPAGRVHMSLRDLSLYLAAHRDEDRFLSSDSWRVLHTPPFGGNYAMGWEIRSDGILWHSGSNALWLAEVLVNKKEGVAAAATTNVANGKASISTGQCLLRAAAA